MRSVLVARYLMIPEETGAGKTIDVSCGTVAEKLGITLPDAEAEHITVRKRIALDSLDGIDALLAPACAARLRMMILPL